MTGQVASNNLLSKLATVGLRGQNKTAGNSGLAKVAVQYSADGFVVNQSLVPRINICGKSRHLRQAASRSKGTAWDLN